MIKFFAVHAFAAIALILISLITALVDLHIMIGAGRQ